MLSPRLPGVSGARLAASLLARMPALQIVLMSGYPDDGEIAHVCREGKAILLNEPFSTTALVDSIAKLLSRDASPRPAAAAPVADHGARS